MSIQFYDYPFTSLDFYFNDGNEKSFKICEICYKLLSINEYKSEWKNIHWNKYF